MEETAISVEELEWKEKAEVSLQNIYLYIYQDSPVNAMKYFKKLIDFGNSLIILPDKYPICKQKSLARRKMRCAVFDKTYIFVYKVVRNILIIYNIIHGKINPRSHSA
ncbi:MAG: type II toxin-antitoxin system RelE/ParE family toxin [Bacteroidota bacterium]